MDNVKIEEVSSKKECHVLCLPPRVLVDVALNALYAASFLLLMLTKLCFGLFILTVGQGWIQWGSTGILITALQLL